MSDWRQTLDFSPPEQGKITTGLAAEGQALEAAQLTEGR